MLALMISLLAPTLDSLRPPPGMVLGLPSDGRCSAPAKRDWKPWAVERLTHLCCQSSPPDAVADYVAETRG